MPILHARTYNIDFRTGKLLVRPIAFSEREAKFCHSVALDSTIFCELSPEEGRVIIYGDGKFVVIGKTVQFNALYSRCEVPLEDRRYVRVDSKDGRLAFGFVGAAFLLNDIKSVNVPVMITDKSLLKIYEDSISERWDETYGSNKAFESSLSKPIDIEFEEILDEEVKEIKKISSDSLPFENHLIKSSRSSGKTIVEDSEKNRNKLIYKILLLAIEGKKISLCTSLTERGIKEGCFTFATCQNIAAVDLDRTSAKTEDYFSRREMHSLPEETSRIEKNPSDLIRSFSVPKDELANLQASSEFNIDYRRNVSAGGKEKSFSENIQQYSAPPEETSRIEKNPSDLIRSFSVPKDELANLQASSESNIDYRRNVSAGGKEKSFSENIQQYSAPQDDMKPYEGKQEKRKDSMKKKIKSWLLE